MQGTRVLHTLGLWRNRRRIREEAQQMMHIGSEQSRYPKQRRLRVRVTVRVCAVSARIVHVYDAKSSGRGGFPGASEAARMRAKRLL